jgi:hypothetical protein
MSSPSSDPSVPRSRSYQEPRARAAIFSNTDRWMSTQAEPVALQATTASTGYIGDARNRRSPSTSTQS